MKPKNEEDAIQRVGAFFRGIAAIIRAKSLAIKHGIRAVGEVGNFPLTYTSSNDVSEAVDDHVTPLMWFLLVWLITGASPSVLV